MTPVLSLVCALLCLSPLAIAARGRSWVSRAVYGACLALSLCLCLASAAAVGASAADIALPMGPFQSGVRFHLDGLAAMFLTLINFAGANASLYAIGYGRHEAEPGRVLPFYPLFLAAMNLAIVAADAYSFLFAWELMSLASWALVVSRRRSVEAMRAGFVYLAMASFGAIALLFAFTLLAGPTGNFAFSAIRAHALSPEAAGAVLILVVGGAGSKAGLWPLHAWLPLAHPAAPSHVSALMSGAMTKVAVYAVLRIVFDLMGAPAWWWSLPALAFGGVTAALGILQALMESDLKRIFAYSTIENIGLVFIAIGLALAFRAGRLDGAAALALTAALFHSLNHMLFKSTLFFGAGAVVEATGERSIERMGGLIRRMPATAVALLVASMAISALPPFNGFASEWLIFQSVLVSPQLSQMGLKLLAPADGVLMALAAALAAACFVRAYGVAFLGRPRTGAAERATETDNWSLAAISLGAALCVLVGLIPGVIIDWLQPAVATIVSGRMPTQAQVSWLSIVPVTASRSSYNGALLFLFLLASASSAALVVHRFASRAVRRAPAWDCGSPDASVLTQYSADSFAQPIRRVFGQIALAAREAVDMPAPGDMRAATIVKYRRDLVWDFAYMPVARAVNSASSLLNRVQYLTIRTYLTFVFVTLVLLLTALALWG